MASFLVNAPVIFFPQRFFMISTTLSIAKMGRESVCF
jgi:hypothetical protein